MRDRSEDLARLRRLPEFLRENIRGQDHLLPRVASVLQRAEMGLVTPGRPRGSFLFVGPTGTGKTELTLSFSRYLYGDGGCHRFDMSEFQRQSSVEVLIGNVDEPRGLLGRVLANRTGGTLLFDEIEKAHPLVLDLLLQMLDPGRITLASGETLLLEPYFVVMTSNIGAAEAMRMEHSLFASVERAVLARVNQTLRPELIARIDEKLVFAPLDYSVQREIAELLVAREVGRLSGIGFDLQVTRDAMEFLIREGHHPQLGARLMRTAIARHLQDAVMRRIFESGQASGLVIVDPTQPRLEVSPVS